MAMPETVRVGWKEYKSTRVNVQEFINSNRDEWEDWRRSMELDDVDDIGKDEVVEWLYDFLESKAHRIEDFFAYPETEDVFDFDIG